MSLLVTRNTTQMYPAIPEHDATYNRGPGEPFPAVGDMIAFEGPYQREGTGTVRVVDWPIVRTNLPPPLDAVYPRACREFKWRASEDLPWQVYPTDANNEEAHCVACGRVIIKETCNTHHCLNCRTKRDDMQKRAKWFKVKQAERETSNIIAPPEQKKYCHACGKQYHGGGPRGIFCTLACRRTGRAQAQRMAYRFEKKEVAQ
jgi:hypothetical protein